MNVREGMRRLGILLGACGGILGGCLAYNDARTTWDNHMAHRKFEALMSSRTMRKVSKTTREDYLKAVPSDKREASQDWFEKNAPTPRSKFGGVPVNDDQRAAPQSQAVTIVKSEPLIPSFKEFKADQAAGQKPDPWEKYAVNKGVNPWAGGDVLVNLDGIKQVTVDEVGAISSIELSTGESVQRVDRQPIKAYLIPLLYPVVGFLFPWGGIRLLTWVGSGFVEPRR